MSATPAHTRNINALYVFWFLRDFQLWIPVWVVFLTLQNGFSLTQVTFVEGLFLIGVVLLEVPTGAVADRFGRPVSLASGAACLAVAVLIFAFATSFPLLLTSFLLWSLAATLMSGADMALLYDTLKAGGREADYERIAGRGTAISAAAAAIATFAGGPVAALYDIEVTIYIGAATCLIAAATALTLWEPPRETTEARPGIVSTIRGAAHEIWNTRDVRAVVLLSGSTFAVLMGLQYLIQPYLIDRDIEVGTVFSMLQVPLMAAGVAGAWFAGRLQASLGSFLPLVALPALGAAACLSLALGPGLSTYVAMPVGFGMIAMLTPIATGYVNRRISSDQRATVLSFQGMVSSFVLALLVPVVGFTTDRWGIAHTFTMLAVLCLLCLASFAPGVVRRRALIGDRTVELQVLEGEPAA